jgi:hypothetical protein
MANVASGNTIAEVASLIGDAARANMLSPRAGTDRFHRGEDDGVELTSPRSKDLGISREKL